MSYTAEEIDKQFSSHGSLHCLRVIHPDEIAGDPELKFFWGKAREAFAAFERAEDEIVRVLDHRYAQGWQ